MRNFLIHRRALLVAATVLTPLGAFAQAFPSKPVTFVVPFAAGSATDQLARALGNSFTEQTKQALAEVDRLLALAGTDKTRILSAQIWLADMADFSKMNAVWDAWAPQGHTPARATGESKLATPDYLVEVIVVALVFDALVTQHAGAVDDAANRAE